jgi:hypothetical protein
MHHFNPRSHDLRGNVSFDAPASHIGAERRWFAYPRRPWARDEIIHEIENRLSVCNKLEETIEQSLQQAEALRQSILKKAFEGRLLTEAELEEVRRSIDWEPAEKLLERIKAEKEKVTSNSSI